MQKDAQSGSWNLVTFPTIQRNSNGPDDDRKRVEDHHQQRHMSASRHDRNYYSSPSQRPSSVPSKTEYPPPAHSRVPTTKSSEKLHQSIPKAEVNMFGYPAYQPTSFFSQEPKGKSDQHHKPSGLIVTKNSMSERERDMLNSNQALLNEHKSSVIVKLDGKNPHHSQMAHSQSPKLQQEMMRHYLPVGGQTHKGIYEYRSPTQSPHHLQQHAPSPHHELGKSGHHRANSGQLPSPHHHRQSPHSHSEVRYRSVSESQASLMYPTSSVKTNSNYPYMSPSPYTVVGSSVSNAKPKVSSPAPHHMYGKPSAGLGNNVNVSAMSRHGHESPVSNASKPLLSSSVSPSPYQQVSPYLAPHPQQTSMPTCLPPPAHSSKPTIYERGLYQSNPVPGGLSAKPSMQHGTSPPTAASAPSPVSRGHPQYSPMLSAQSVQTAPLDLGVSSTSKYDSALSPKRKASTPVSSASSGGSAPVCLELKKRRVETPSPQSHYATTSQPQLARVSEPSPLIASAATTITTVVNTAAYRGAPCTTSPVMLTQNPGTPIQIPTPSSTPTPSHTPTPTPATLSETLPEISVTTVLTSDKSPGSDSAVVNLTTQSQPQPQLQLAESPNSTPVKSAPPSAVDSEKSNSPGPSKSSASYPVRHLKKAWLQRHTGEDLEDTTGVIGSGTCVTLPIPITVSNPSAKEPATATSAATTATSLSSLHNIGSMAVNSISKGKHFSSKQNSRKTAHKELASSLNGHQDSNKGDDSSSSDPERGRKSPPKRKPPKVKRKKGGGAQKKNAEEHKKRKVVVGNQSVPASESGSESEKESGSEKDSDSGASSTVTTKKTAKEPRKRGRRPKSSKNDKGEEPRTKKSKDDSLPQRDPFRKPPVGQLKKTGESFLQDGPCFEVAPKLAKCRECRWTPNQRSKNMPNIFCRFYAFRRLRYTKNGQLAIAGFSDPYKDALEVTWFIEFLVAPCLLTVFCFCRTT